VPSKKAIDEALYVVLYQYIGEGPNYFFTEQ